MKMKTDFGTYDVELRVSRYSADNSVALLAFDPKEGPIATLTVCLNDKSLEYGTSYIDTNNCPWALDFIVKNGFGKQTGKTRQSGFCIYPQVRFNMDRLEAANG